MDIILSLLPGLYLSGGSLSLWGDGECVQMASTHLECAFIRAKKVLPINGPAKSRSMDLMAISTDREVLQVELIDLLDSLNNGGQFLQHLSQVWATIAMYMHANVFICDIPG